MTVRVFVQNEAGSTLKHHHDEKTCAFLHSTRVSNPYPFPYGFIIGTDSGDGCNVDCFVVTGRTLRTGDIVECEPVALMEQFEDGIDDHNVLARLPDDPVEITAEVEAALTAHLLRVFRHVDEKQISVGRFLGSAEAEAHITSHVSPE